MREIKLAALTLSREALVLLITKYFFHYISMKRQAALKGETGLAQDYANRANVYLNLADAIHDNDEYYAFFISIAEEHAGATMPVAAFTRQMALFN